VYVPPLLLPNSPVVLTPTVTKPFPDVMIASAIAGAAKAIATAPTKPKVAKVNLFLISITPNNGLCGPDYKH
jgi:hypothetical protein